MRKENDGNDDDVAFIPNFCKRKFENDAVLWDTASSCRLYMLCLRVFWLMNSWALGVFFSF